MSFYPPAGVTVCGTRQDRDPLGEGGEFLYACWRDGLWNPDRVLVAALSGGRFPYACRRDGLWNSGSFQGPYDLVEFLYACRRDGLWNPTPPGESVTSRDAPVLQGSTSAAVARDARSPARSQFAQAGDLHG